MNQIVAFVLFTISAVAGYNLGHSNGLESSPEYVAYLEKLDIQNTESFIQSGNIAPDQDRLCEELFDAVRDLIREQGHDEHGEPLGEYPYR